MECLVTAPANIYQRRVVHIQLVMTIRTCPDIHSLLLPGTQSTVCPRKGHSLCHRLKSKCEEDSKYTGVMCGFFFLQSLSTPLLSPLSAPPKLGRGEKRIKKREKRKSPKISGAGKGIISLDHILLTRASSSLRQV